MLWTVLNRPGFEPTPGSPHGRRFVVEALDIEAGVLLASRVLDLGVTLPRFAGNYVWQTVEDGGEEFIEVSRLRVVR